MLTYGGAVITAYFFSTSGGRTENVENVFGGSAAAPVPGERRPTRYDRISPLPRSWPDPPSFTAAGLGRLLGLGGPAATVEVLSRGVSPRVPAGAHHGALGAAASMVTGIELRSALGLRDTWFRVIERASARRGRRLVGSS